MLVEMADMREANRSYEANLQVIKQAREMISMTIDLLRNAHDRSHLSDRRRQRRHPTAAGSARIAPARAVTPAAAAEAAGADFGGHAGADAAQRGERLVRNAEAHVDRRHQGQASVQQVVEAVMSAEQTLQGAIAIRDKVVAAYLEISRMQI